MRLILLPVSPFQGAGQLSWPAWQAVREAAQVLVSASDPAWPAALAEAGAEPLSVAAAEVEHRLAAAPAGPVLWVLDAADVPGSVTEADLARAHAAAGGDDAVTVLEGPAEAPGSRLLRTVQIMDALRSPGGDAWSAAQTHQSLARYLLEEAHEVLDVIEDPHPAGSSPGALADELGDLLFQILFHARIGQEEPEPWSVDDVARALIAKMERRNPHVFGADPGRALADREDVEAIVAQWHAAKAAEGAPTGLLAGVPEDLGALQRAAKAVHRARSRGELPALLARAHDAAAAGDPDTELARELLDRVVVAEARDTDPETALRTLLRQITEPPALADDDQDPRALPGAGGPLD